MKPRKIFHGINFLRSAPYASLFLLPLLLFAVFAGAAAQTPTQKAQAAGTVKHGTEEDESYSEALVQSGDALFRQDCAFCHGRKAGGGETGPDLTRSKLVTADVDGDKIGPVIRNGRPDKGMPPFDRSDEQIASLVAFIHAQQTAALAQKGGRKGVDASDLQTGNAEAGKKYFNGAGGCANCHSPTGDLAGIAARFEGLQLEEQMLYPKHAKSKVTVTLASGQSITGTLEYLDEFTIGLFDSTGMYRSWRTQDVKYKVDPGMDAHVELFGKYTDADIHDLMAYLQTLR
jgi:cytochrome c oxidase cbb3-type subunit III